MIDLLFPGITDHGVLRIFFAALIGVPYPRIGFGVLILTFGAEALRRDLSFLAYWGF